MVSRPENSTDVVSVNLDALAYVISIAKYAMYWGHKGMLTDPKDLEAGLQTLLLVLTALPMKDGKIDEEVGEAIVSRAEEVERDIAKDMNDGQIFEFEVGNN